jgi:hypothetical protein
MSISDATSTVICLLFGGEASCIEHVYRSLLEGIMVVVVNESNGLADLIAYAKESG